ncbi:BT4734/BF3469 family protein [Bacteroides acidifaciens]|uniref:Helicase n=2 Tax=Bacteroides acidifaciens TaxID=85831 RepID=A0A4S2B3M7_9BACE|nr:BT4734/BF3469 family protein [Bacteroides acidifaciens]TGY08689.1 helicase [Bacteroides acidifaciens]
MRITQIRDDGKVNTLRTLKIEQLVEQMKVETKAQLVSAMREVLPYILPGDKNDYVQKVPKLLPAAAFIRKNGIMTMSEYNGIVMLQVNNLSGLMEADAVKERVKELPQTYLAFTGSSGKSVKIWVRFTYPDDLLPVDREQAELFHAHAYRLAVKFYQPQLPFDIDLKEPSLEQYCRLTYDPDLYFNPEAMPIYMKQPMAMPTEMTYREQVQTEASPLQRLAPGYESHHALSVLFEAAFARALDEQQDGYSLGDDIHSLLVCLAGHCFRAGIPEEDTVRWTRAHYRLPEDDFLIRETVRNVYRTSKGFADKSSLLPEQLFVMQMDEFMKRRYEFRFNQLTSQVECRQRNSFDFYFRPVDRRLMASITMNAQYEGLKLWDKDVVRYLNSDRVPLYQPVEEFLYGLPHWDGKDHIGDLAKRVPCDNPHWAQLFRRWFLSMVAHWRGLSKNHANSTSPILVGPQAYRKSTFCRLILPPCLQAYYTDSIDFSRKRDAELYLNRFLLINMDEFDQIGINQQSFVKHILQKPVVNTRRPNASAVEELRRYASFIGTSNHKDLLTDTSGSRRYIGVEVTGVIDVVRPIDYEQLYAQAMAALYHNERYWFDEKEEAILTEANQEFEQSPAIEQLFLVYYRVAEDEEEGEWLLAADLLQRIQKASKMKFSPGQVNYFGRILQRLGVQSYRKTRGVYYHVVAVG